MLSGGFKRLPRGRGMGGGGAASGYKTVGGPLGAAARPAGQPLSRPRSPPPDMPGLCTAVMPPMGQRCGPGA